MGDRPRIHTLREGEPATVGNQPSNQAEKQEAVQNGIPIVCAAIGLGIDSWRTGRGWTP